MLGNNISKIYYTKVTITTHPALFVNYAMYSLAGWICKWHPVYHSFHVRLLDCWTKIQNLPDIYQQMATAAKRWLL